MGDGDLDAVLALYEPDAAFASRSGEVLIGQDALRGQFAPPPAARADFQLELVKIIETGDLALLHSEVRMTRAQPTTAHATEVLRKQPNGDWLLAIGDPFSIR